MSDTLRIVADENIPYVRQAFAGLGSVTCFNGRQLRPDHLTQADLLLVRSVTRVNAELLRDSPVRFVGSATIGFDHVDLDYLKQRGVGFARAPGSNATSAAEYVLNALLLVAESQGFALQDKTVGLIGCGNVGSRVKRKLETLGVRCLVNDPPRQAEDPGLDYVDLATLLEADIVSLHVPLERHGQYPTWRLAGEAFFNALRPDAIFINTARGQVVDEAALKQKLAACPQFTAILDVWDNEPRIDPELLRRVFLGTPHIAGYSFDGKVRGTEMLFRAVCEHFQLDAAWPLHASLPPPGLTRLDFSSAADINAALGCAALACYDPRRDDAALRRLGYAADPGVYFDQLRKNYPPRREFNCVEIHLPPGHDAWVRLFSGLGFRVAE